MSTLATRTRNLPLTAVFIGAVFTSLSAISYQLSDASAPTATFIRPLVSLPILAVLFWLGRGRDQRTWADRRMAMASGVILTIDLMLWSLAIDNIGAGLATLIANSQVVVVPLVTWALFSEHPTRRALAAMPVVLVGLALVTGLGSQSAFGQNPVRGVLQGVGAAAFYSAFLVVFRRSNARLAPSAGPLFDVGVGATVSALLAGPFFADFDPTPTGSTLFWLVALGVGAMSGWLLIGYALPRIPAAHTSFAILLQPCLTIVWGAVLLAERPSFTQFAGVAVVLGGITLAISRRVGA